MQYAAKDLMEITELNFLWETNLPGGELVVVEPLVFHVAVFIDYSEDGGIRNYKDRYCFSNLDIAKIAISEFIETGEMKYWQKWHNKQISIHENYAYAEGQLHEPEYASYKVEWNSCEIRERYPYELLV